MNRNQFKSKLYLSGMDNHAIELARRENLGFEVTAYSWAAQFDNKSLLPEIKAQISGIDRLWFHAPFAELTACAIDPMVRDVTIKRYRQSVMTAQQLGIQQIIFHDGFVPAVYFPEWFTTQSVTFWKDYLQDMPQDMTFVLENVMDPSPNMLVTLMEEIADPRLGICLDIGHANTYVSKLPPQEWIAPMAPWLRHVHLHNNYGNWDDHNSLGDGIIPMESVLDELLTTCPNATYTIENQNCASSIAWLKAHGYLGEDND